MKRSMGLVLSFVLIVVAGCKNHAMKVDSNDTLHTQTIVEVGKIDHFDKVVFITTKESTRPIICQDVDVKVGERVEVESFTAVGALYPESVRFARRYQCAE